MKQYKLDLTEIFRKSILKLDIAFHVIAAVMLLIACSFILYYAMLNILHPSRESVIHLINDVLLALIVLELLWTVNRFLMKQKFLLGPFLAIGIIVGIRRILLIEAQTSLMEHASTGKLYEIGLSAAVVIILTIAFYIAAKAQKLE